MRSNWRHLVFVSMMVTGSMGLVGSGCGKSEPAPAAAADAAPAAGGGRKIDLTDSKDVEKVCLDALAAYRDKNLERLAELGPASAKEKLIFLEPRNPNYQTLLGDDTWRMKSLKAWDGKLEKIARGIDDVARCVYHSDAEFTYEMEVRKDQGRWTFFDIMQTPKKAAAAPAPTSPATP